VLSVYLIYLRDVDIEKLMEFASGNAIGLLG
jgi:hypothetical protein